MSYQTAACRKLGFTCSMCVSGADGAVRERDWERWAGTEPWRVRHVGDWVKRVADGFCESRGWVFCLFFSCNPPWADSRCTPGGERGLVRGRERSCWQHRGEIRNSARSPQSQAPLRHTCPSHRGPHSGPVHSWARAQNQHPTDHASKRPMPQLLWLILR